MNGENLSITIKTILTVMGIITAAGGAIGVIIKVLSPYNRLKKRVSKHDDLLENDNNRLKEIEESNKHICKSMLVLLDHEITGNSIEKLKNAKSEMQEYLINK
ncbi:CTP synthase [Lacrimispora sp. NSJ-141]|uniref:CTP synthase n=1 Tax=Lientehia hominis TaxID=2897778 RepID=A0AAP2RJH1_9FIRM|nr:CTP synthase [Lientehia hominis]MCD2493322.1 CTP synthase [Lientehia hominis]